MEINELEKELLEKNKRRQQMALYEDLGTVDVISAAIPLLLEHGFKLGADGKITGEITPQILVDGTWINARIGTDRNCFLWHKIYFMQYGIISRNCFNCWKIACRPKTLDDLFKIQALQKKMDLPSKCGLERRDGSLWKGAFASFWYGPLGDLEGSKKLKTKVTLEIRKELPITTEVILKRGCTEMEDSAGPSESWKFDSGQHQFEDLLDATWDLKVLDWIEPQNLRVSITRSWIGWAVRNRDKTADKYYESIRSFGVVPTTTYHDKDVKLVSLPHLGRPVEVYKEFGPQLKLVEKGEADGKR